MTDPESTKPIRPDIFAPYIEFETMAGAGMYKIHGGSGALNTFTYEAGLGSPLKPSLGSAFALALSSQIPLWTREGIDEYRLLYHPDPKILLGIL